MLTTLLSTMALALLVTSISHFTTAKELPRTLIAGLIVLIAAAVMIAALLCAAGHDPAWYPGLLFPLALLIIGTRLVIKP